MIKPKDASARTKKEEFCWNVNRDRNGYTFSNRDVTFSVRIIKS